LPRRCTPFPHSHFNLASSKRGGGALLPTPPPPWTLSRWLAWCLQAVFNPKDPNTFASASLDRSIKVWGLTSPAPHFTLEGHDKGVNCIDYFAGRAPRPPRARSAPPLRRPVRAGERRLGRTPRVLRPAGDPTGGDKPYLISGADDKTVKLWDYQARTCVQTLSDHTHNVSAVAFHPDLPIILTGAEDGAVRIFHANTFNLENTLNYGMERVWAIACKKGSSRVGLGYDEGSAMIKLGKEQPVASMDQTSGKIIWARWRPPRRRRRGPCAGACARAQRRGAGLTGTGPGAGTTRSRW